MVGGAHPDTPLVGVQNTTPVGSARNTTPVGEAHKPPVSKAHMASQTESAGTAGPRASMSPAQTSRIEGPRDAPSYVPNQSPTPHRKLELRRKGPTFVPVISPLTKAAPLRNHRKGQAAKQKVPNISNKFIHLFVWEHSGVTLRFTIKIDPSLASMSFLAYQQPIAELCWSLLHVRYTF